MEGILAYQLPGTNRIEAFYGKWESISLNTLEEVKEGFVFVDFLQESTFQFTPTRSFNWLSEKLVYKPLSEKLYAQKTKDKTEYLTICNQFIKACEEGQQQLDGIQKLVLSRVKNVSLPIDFDVQHYFSKVCETYHHSFNYFIHIPNQTTWLGATPEELIVEQKNHYSTVSLAGTRSLNDSNPFEDKEKEEQSIVTNYIKNVLSKNGEVFSVSEHPEEVVAGNLRHLKSTFKIKKTTKPLNLAKLLHPTPAICGFPKKSAFEYILRHENYQRKYYSGFLGMIQPNDSYLYVNLRCAELFENYMNIYVGGGITASSIAEKEWDETENKSQTLLKLL